MRPPDRTVQRELARIATAQHGVVTRGQLLAAGLRPDHIRRRLDNGVLLRVHPGVYRVGHRAPSAEARYMAAVLACGEGALLSGRAAGWLLAILKGRPPPPEVTAPRQRRLPGVHTRRSRNLSRADAIRWRGIPTTTVPRTLVDLAAVLSFDALARACHEAGVLHRTTPAHVERVLARHPTAPGAGDLRRIIHGDARVTISKLEKRSLELLEANGLPLPQTNRRVGAHRVDCCWPERRLTVELDSYRYHRSRHAWEQDRRRERDARARGDEFRRYTYGDVFEDPRLMLRELRELLSATPAPGAAPGPGRAPRR